MAGSIFLGTLDLKKIGEFYTDMMEMEIWLEQAECIIMKHGNLLIGFCQREISDTTGIITLFFDKEEEVDRFFKKFKNLAEGPPRINERYSIYHFFARDPEGRRLEFQKFLHEVPSLV